MAAPTWGPTPGVQEEEHLSHIHPLILHCISPYYTEFNRKVNLGNILAGAQTEMKDLPLLEDLLIVMG